MATCWQGLWAYRSYLIVLLLPILLLPLPILIPTKMLPALSCLQYGVQPFH